MRLQFLGCGDAFAQRWPVQHVLSPPLRPSLRASYVGYVAKKFAICD
jgi:hypothetical protein